MCQRAENKSQSRIQMEEQKSKEVAVGTDISVCV